VRVGGVKRNVGHCAPMWDIWTIVAGGVGEELKHPPGSRLGAEGMEGEERDILTK